MVTLIIRQPLSDGILLFYLCFFFLTIFRSRGTNQSIEAFKEGKKDVLVATDVASKGLDFPAIQHVVNYDMPEEIENYGEMKIGRNYITLK